jgi:hypothetical protein
MMHPQKEVQCAVKRRISIRTHCHVKITKCRKLPALYSLSRKNQGQQEIYMHLLIRAKEKQGGLNKKLNSLVTSMS